MVDSQINDEVSMAEAGQDPRAVARRFYDATAGGGTAHDLAGKVVLVVGGTRNQGAAIATSVVARGATTTVSYAGDDVAAAGTLEQLRGLGAGPVEAIRSDATVSAEVDALVNGVVARHGRLDAVVHLPGAVLRKPLVELTDAEFDWLLDRNTRSAFHTLRAAGRALADGGRYVVLSTTLTAVMTGPYGAYSGSKAAVERMVVAAARELAGRSITVNAVAPGPVDDDFYRGAETEATIQGATGASPRGRLGRPQDVAPVVTWLLSEGAGWVSGQTLRVNGAMF